MINFSTDYHLGSTLNMHTTHSSRIALRDALFAQAMKVTEDTTTPHYLAGDLVHTYKNEESVIQQALQILSRVSNCIMGNHDWKNRKDSMGTMTLLEPLVDMVPAVMNKCEPHYVIEDKTGLTLVPHTNTQELFESCLNILCSEGGVPSRTGNYPEILILHCNYDHPWEKNETTLDLTPDMAEKLLKVFDYILIGHEHNHREDFDGRLILMGNIHPTNFGDISDKYSWYFEDGKMHHRLIWEKKKHYLQIPADYEGEIGEDIQFVKITGEVLAADYPNYCKNLSKLWKANPHCFAIRSAVEIVSENSSLEVDMEQLKNLTETIQEELEEDKELSQLFDNLLEQV